MTFRKIGETAVRTPFERVMLFLLATIFFLSVTAFAVPPVMYEVTIYDGNSVTVVSTSRTEPTEILEDAGINVNTAYGDTLSLRNFDGENGSVIVIKRGVKVNIKSFDGSSYTVYAYGKVSDALEKAGITLKDGARCNYETDKLLEDGMTIEVYDVFNINLTADGKTVAKKVSGKTVADALEELGVTLGKKDYTEPSTASALKEGLKIEVFRVKVKTRSADETIKYDTEYTYSDSLYKNQSRVLKQGQNGSKTVVFEDCYINGKLARSTVKSEKVNVEPVKELVQVGTKVNAVPTSAIPVGSPISEMAVPSYLQIGANGLPSTYKSVINAKATAYCIPGGTTSTGKKAQTGYIAVDPKEIPYGTEMYIVSADGKYVYGYCIAADTGSYINDVDWTVDLFMNSEQQCINWGRRDVIIYVL